MRCWQDTLALPLLTISTLYASLKLLRSLTNEKKFPDNSAARHGVFALLRLGTGLGSVHNPRGSVLRRMTFSGFGRSTPAAMLAPAKTRGRSRTKGRWYGSDGEYAARIGGNGRHRLPEVHEEVTSLSYPTHSDRRWTRTEKRVTKTVGLFGRARTAKSKTPGSEDDGIFLQQELGAGSSCGDTVYDGRSGEGAAHRRQDVARVSLDGRTVGNGMTAQEELFSA